MSPPMVDAGFSARRLPMTHFGPEAFSVSAARRLLLDFLDAHVADDVKMVAALLVSELTTNVVIHARTPFSLCAELTESRLRVEVADGSTEQPVVLDPRPNDPTGRGVKFVSVLSSAWGTDPIPDGKLVWFELARFVSEAEDVGDARNVQQTTDKT